MSPVEEVMQELRKVSSLVNTARRLLGSGAMIDLSALDEKVRLLCERAQGLDSRQGRGLVPAFEELIERLDALAEELEARHGHFSDTGRGR